jgi:hypothetical protein
MPERMQFGGPGSGPQGGGHSENTPISVQKVRRVKLPKMFKKYGRNIGSLPPAVLVKYKAWVKTNWGA